MALYGANPVKNMGLDAFLQQQTGQGFVDYGITSTGSGEIQQLAASNPQVRAAVEAYENQVYTPQVAQQVNTLGQQSLLSPQSTGGNAQLSNMMATQTAAQNAQNAALVSSLNGLTNSFQSGFGDLNSTFNLGLQGLNQSFLANTGGNGYLQPQNLTAYGMPQPQQSGGPFGFTNPYSVT